MDPIVQGIHTLITIAVGMSFVYPMSTTETPYLQFGQPYGSGKWVGRPHPGVDFLGPDSAPIYAAARGRVVLDKNDPDGYGHYIMIQHKLNTGEFMYTLYAHLQHASSIFGHVVEVGDIIGHQGASGYAGRPHLHFECKRTPDLSLYTSLSYSTLHKYWFDPYSVIEGFKFDPTWP